MFSSNSRSHQRPFGWGLAGAGNSGTSPQPPNTPPPQGTTAASGSGTQPSSSATAAPTTSSSTASSTGNNNARPASANSAAISTSAAASNATPGSHTQPTGSAAFFRSAMLQGATTTTNSGSGTTSKLSGSGTAVLSSTAISGLIPTTSSPSLSGSGVLGGGVGRSMSVGTVVSVPIGSALNATRATHMLTSTTTTGGAGGGASSTSSSSNPNSAREATSALAGGRFSHRRLVLDGAAEEEEDFSRDTEISDASAAATLRGTNLLSPSGMSGEQTHRLVALLTGAKSSKIADASSTPSSSMLASPSASRSFTVKDDAATLRSVLKTKGVKDTHLVAGEVQSRIRLFDLFHYWSTLPETTAEIKSLCEEALAAMRSSAPSPPEERSLTAQKTSPRAFSNIILGAKGGQQQQHGASSSLSSLGIAGPRLGHNDVTGEGDRGGGGGPLEDSASRPMASSTLITAEANDDSNSIPALMRSPNDSNSSIPNTNLNNNFTNNTNSSMSPRTGRGDCGGSRSARSQANSVGGGKQMNREPSYRSLRVGRDDNGIDDGDDALPLMSTQREEATEPIETILGVAEEETSQRESGPSDRLMIDVTPPAVSDATSAAAKVDGGPIPSSSSPVTTTPSKSQANSKDGQQLSSSAHRHAKSPRGPAALPCPPSANSSLEGSVGRVTSGVGGGASPFNGFHVVDEVDAAHARGGLSPRVGNLAINNSNNAAGNGGRNRSNSGAKKSGSGFAGDVGGGDASTSLNESFRSGEAQQQATATINDPLSKGGAGTPVSSRSAGGTPNRTRSPVEGSPHHAGASNTMLESNQARPPSPLFDMSKRVGGEGGGGGRSPSPSMRSDSRDASYTNEGGAGATNNTNPKAAGLLRTNSGTGQRPNIPKASTPRGGGSRAHSPTPKEGSGAGAAAAAPPPAKKYATYDDVPRFYFGDGKPDSGRSATIVEPHFKRHENPHLKAFDGIAIPPAQLEQIKAAAAAAEAEKKAVAGGGSASSTTSSATNKKNKKLANAAIEDSSPTKAGSKESANSESFSLSTIDPAAFAGLNIPQPGYRLAPMMPLIVMEDQDVSTFIQREFDKVPPHPGPAPAPMTVPSSSAMGRTTSAKTSGARGVLGGKKGVAGASAGGATGQPTNAAAIAAHAKADTAYRTALFTCMSNVVGQAYGLPRYFTAMIMKRLIVDHLAALGGGVGVVGDSASKTSGGAATSSSASSGVGPKSGGPATTTGTPPPPPVQCVEGVPIGIITAEAANDFYERHMRFSSPIRRMFSALVCCNLTDGGILPPSAPSPSSEMSSILLPTSNFTESNSLDVTAASNSPLTTSTASVRRRNYLVREDFIPYLDALLELHPGLAFLRQTADFQVKYVETILVRIFFECDLHDRGRISWPEFERSKLPDAIRQVEVAEDINAVLNFFSYEHFYVIYCRFWELDSDRDMVIDAADLSRYFQEGTANSKVIERIFQGHGRKLMAPPVPTPPSAGGGAKKAGGAMTLAAKRAAAAAAAADPAGIANKRMGYEDFVWFCLAEEDKTSPRAIRYWFSILDLDADGVICGWELEQFYNCTREAMVAITSEFISFEDIMCQIVDMVPALSEGHSALDRSFDRQRLLINSNATGAGGGGGGGGKGPTALPLPLQSASLSDKVRRRSSLTSGPLGGLPPPPPPLQNGVGGKSRTSSPSSTSANQQQKEREQQQQQSGGPLLLLGSLLEDPRERYHRYGLTLRDLLASPESAHVALNMVLNVVKFLMFEQKDPFVSHHDRLMGGYEGTEWDRFARMEYDRMAAEADE